MRELVSNDPSGAILKRANRRHLMHVYVHIPFCHRICPYCSFYKHTPGDTDQRAFIDAIVREAHARKNGATIKTLYFGGGTPSMLSPTNLQRLFDGLNNALDLSQTSEITLEANPATFDLKKAQLFKSLGIDRVSLGIQSFTPHVLETLGREHSPEQAKEAVAILREAEMQQINIDLMFSIPGQSIDDWRSTLETSISLKPNHISAYNLTYEEDTAFFERLQKGAYRDDDDTNADHFNLANDLLSENGFIHYETSNYAQPGSESQHNRAYWIGNDYLGLGPSAVSTIQRQRKRNVPDTAKYISMVASIGHASFEEEVLNDEQFYIERLALMLRTKQGVPKQFLKYCSASAIETVINEDLAIWINDHLVLRNQGPLLVDEVAAYLL